MRRALLIAKRDYLISIRSKTFLIGLIIFPLMFGGSMLGIALMRARPDLKDRRVALVDRTGKLADWIEAAAERKNKRDVFDKKTGLQTSPRYVIEPVAAGTGDPASQRLALSDEVRNHRYFAFLDIAADVLTPEPPGAADAADGKEKKAPVDCYTDAGAVDQFASWLSGAVNEGIRMERLAAAGVEQAKLPAMLAGTSMDSLNLLVRDPKTGAVIEPVKRDEVTAFLAPFGTMMLLGMIVMIGSMPMLGAITEDKSQRVVEMLLGVATPLDLMAGKVLAGVGRALTSSILYVGVATVSLVAMQVAGVATLSLMGWFYVYLLAEVSLLCSLAAALGAACNTPQEAQNLAMIVLSPVIIPMFLLMPILNKPQGAMATALSLFPPFTPLVMLLRQALPGGVPAWEPWVGLIGVIACSGLGIWAASRVFRVAILSQGQPFRMANLARWVAKG
jgi:ABC-type Na+ efflux pump permease subunit